MTQKKKEIVIQQEEAVPLEVLSSSIVKLSKAADALLNSGLHQRAIVLLLWDSIPGHTINRSQITQVLDALPKLAKRYTSK